MFPLILRERDDDKMRFQPAKTHKMITFFRTLEFLNFEVIYEEQVMAHIQTHTNTTSKLKNCTIFPLILREIDADKSVQDVVNQNLEVIYDEQLMAHIQYQ
jgi:hypothetical protein